VLPYSAILLSALALASAGALHAQEIKPRSTTDRLPKPAGVSAAQQPDGRIRLVWRTVDGAARYKVIRSVPPDASKPVTLPNPSDTQYVDADVKPGCTFYYVVSAVN
jgi:fibronectin type 3 domain-containing protein